MMVRQYSREQLIVAHVDHGIRSDSADDAKFVRALARHYGVRFRQTQLQLGSAASEDNARQARYGFLRKVATDNHATLVTAHHADDVIESIAINITRGTGWRGLAVMNAADILRPLTTMFKAEIIKYAAAHNLQWHEDSTNATDVYLRNRLRRQMTILSQDEKMQLLSLWREQQRIAGDIEHECLQLATNQRYFYIMSDEKPAIEILSYWLKKAGVALMYPQLRRVLISIKTARSGTFVELAAGRRLKIAKRDVHLN